MRCTPFVLSSAVCFSSFAMALDGGTSRITPANGWQVFEVITETDDPTGDGYAYAMPNTFDGTGALLVNSNTLRFLVNHEIADANISEVNVDLANFKTAISNLVDNGNTGSVSFVLSARQAYARWSDDGGANWVNTTDTSNTDFSRFCSGQSYEPDTFGANRGFVDHLYITGEEGGSGRLFTLDSTAGDLYQLSGVSGDASGLSGGLGGLSYDAWENAALVDTGETQHVALMLSPDGGSQVMQLYIGIKGKDANGNPSGSFLARNGLAYGSYFYFKGALPASVGDAGNGTFDTSISGALLSSKLEDIDTSPDQPTRVVLGDQNSGVFVFDLNLVFTGGAFDAASSGFSISKIDEHADGLDSADNVDWTAATTLGGTPYPAGLIFVNEDNASGEIWQMLPDGSNQTKVGETTVGAESSGVFDLSAFVGYKPGSVLMTSNQGWPSSLTVLVNPQAELAGPVNGTVENDFNNDGSADVLLRRSSDGYWQFFRMQNGVAVSSNVYGAYTNTAWTLIASEDFDADGDTDILLRNTSSGAWRMFITQNGMYLSDSNFSAYNSTDWMVASLADYNGDNTKDLLLHNTVGGSWRVFYINSGAVSGSASMNLFMVGWDLKYDGDIDGDGDADIILRRASDGYWRQFTIAGGVVASNSAVNLYQSQDWQIQFASDLDNDGDDDIVMRSSTGNNWRTFNVASGTVGSNSKLSMYENASWSFDHLNDVDMDGDDDIVLRSNTGGWRLFLTDGLDTPANAGIGLYANSQWVKADVVDVNGDGTKDVILNNTSSGAWRAFMIEAGTVVLDTNPGLYQNTDWTLQNQ